MDDRAELLAIDQAISRALDALESDATLNQRREAFSGLQDLYEPGRLMARLKKGDPLAEEAPWRYVRDGHLPEHGQFCDVSMVGIDGTIYAYPFCRYSSMSGSWRVGAGDRRPRSEEGGSGVYAWRPSHDLAPAPLPQSSEG